MEEDGDIVGLERHAGGDEVGGEPSEDPGRHGMKHKRVPRINDHGEEHRRHGVALSEPFCMDDVGARDAINEDARRSGSKED